MFSLSAGIKRAVDDMITMGAHDIIWDIDFCSSRGFSHAAGAYFADIWWPISAAQLAWCRDYFSRRLFDLTYLSRDARHTRAHIPMTAFAMRAAAVAYGAGIIRLYNASGDFHGSCSDIDFPCFTLPLHLRPPAALLVWLSAKASCYFQTLLIPSSYARRVLYAESSLVCARLPSIDRVGFDEPCRYDFKVLKLHCMISPFPQRRS